MSNNVSITGVHKGDTIEFVCTLYSDTAQTVIQPIVGWLLRAEIYDSKGSSIRLANAASGGDSTQIENTDSANGIFTVKVSKDTTTAFNDSARLEIEAEDPNGKQYTVSKNDITFKKQRITWKTP